MSDDQHPFDRAAESLEKMADQPVAGQDASSDLWELRFATDDSVGDYPQAMPLVEPKAWEPGDPIDETGGLDGDGFPNLPDGLEAQQLQPTAKWTDVLSSNLWNDGYLLNEKALKPFRQAELGEFREYPVTVVDSQGDERPYTYLFVKNEIPPSALDFERSEFYITDMLSTPIAPVTINSYEEWLTTLERASAGELEGGEEFSSIAYKKLYFRAGHAPEVEVFRLKRLCVTTYISTRFKVAFPGRCPGLKAVKPLRGAFRLYTPRPPKIQGPHPSRSHAPLGDEQPTHLFLHEGPRQFRSPRQRPGNTTVSSHNRPERATQFAQKKQRRGATLKRRGHAAR